VLALLLLLRLRLWAEKGFCLFTKTSFSCITRRFYRNVLLYAGNSKNTAYPEFIDTVLYFDKIKVCSAKNQFC
jgi:hypothetical protein